MADNKVKSEYLKLVEDIDKKHKENEALTFNLEHYHKLGTHQGLENALKKLKKGMAPDKAGNFTVGHMLADEKNAQIAAEEIYEEHKKGLQSVFGIKLDGLSKDTTRYLTDSLMGSNVRQFASHIANYKHGFTNSLYDPKNKNSFWAQHYATHINRLEQTKFDHLNADNIETLLKGDESVAPNSNVLKFFNTDDSKEFKGLPFLDKNRGLAQQYIVPAASLAHTAYKKKGLSVNAIKENETLSSLFGPYLADQYKEKDLVTKKKVA
ncbi:hypothetical protein K9L97_04005 [Candidatus Woesearchaeota archaeon]|nr:hypothetical protein [Candidatus Woesearchaeota archaeon]